MEKLDYKTGEVRQILSGNGVQLAGPIDPETGVPRTKFLTLSGITSPDFSTFDKENPRQQPFGFKAREYLRNLIQGQKVEFAIEHKIKDSNDKVVGHLKFNGEDVALEMLRRGLVQVREGSKAHNAQQYQDAESLAKSKNLGIWDIKKKEKEVIEFVPLKPIEVAEKMVGQKFVGGIVEDVQALFVFYVYVKELKGLLKCCLGDIFPPNMNQLFSKKTKWALDGLMYQQECDIQVQGYDEKLQAVRVDIFKGKMDIKKELLSQGYYKLGQNAYQLIGQQQRFNELRDSQTQAEIKGVGIWKDTKAKAQSNQIQTGEKSFQGKVVEIHSGDCLSVFNDKTREVQRVYLASIRAPVYSFKEQKPWGFESKETLRRHAIGKQVQVEVEYEKKVVPKIVEGEEDKKPQAEMLMTFVNVILLDKEEKLPNVSALLVQAGLASVLPPRGDDGCSRHMDELRAASEIAMKAKKGINGKEALIPKLNDFTTKGGAGKAKESFQFLKNEKKISGVVDLVLNGCRLKIRVAQNNSLNLFLLQGIKCLPNDPNFPEFQKFSNLALQYAKQNVLQRDVEIDLESVDKRGVYHGHVFLNKQNFALKLLELGLAVTHSPFGTHKFSSEFEEAESLASKRKEGLWSISNLNLALIRGYDDEQVNQTTMKALNGKAKMMIATEIIDATQIYLQDPTSTILKTLGDILHKFQPDEGNKLVAPLKKGLQCLAQFSADDIWYRAKIVREVVQKGKDPRYEVFFIDYGNFDIVPIQHVRKMPDSLNVYPPQVIRTALAYCNAPTEQQEFGEEVLLLLIMRYKAAQFIKSQIWEKDIQVEMNHTDGITNYATLYLTKEKSLDKTLNFLLLSRGLAKLDKSQPQCNHQQWVQAASDAESESKGVWNIDEEEDY